MDHMIRLATPIELTAVIAVAIPNALKACKYRLNGRA